MLCEQYPYFYILKVGSKIAFIDFEKMVIVTKWVCDFSSQDISSHETVSLHSDPNHNYNSNLNHNYNPNTNTDPNLNPNFAMAVTCLKIKGCVMNCPEMNCPVPHEVNFHDRPDRDTT